MASLHYGRRVAGRGVGNDAVTGRVTEVNHRLSTHFTSEFRQLIRHSAFRFLLSFDSLSSARAKCIKTKTIEIDAIKH